MDDRTEYTDFLMENADRWLAWDTVHIAFCAGITLPPSRIAQRIGVDTPTVYAIMDKVGDNIRKEHQTVAR